MGVIFKCIIDKSIKEKMNCGCVGRVETSRLPNGDTKSVLYLNTPCSIHSEVFPV